MMRYDGRNPYGSRGGYVRDRYMDIARGRDMDMDMARGRDREMDMRRGRDNARNYDRGYGEEDMGRYYNYDTRGSQYYESDYDYEQQEPQRYSGYHEKVILPDGGHYYPFELSGKYGRFYQPDYGRMEEDFAMGNRRDYRRNYGRDSRRDYGKQEMELKKHEQMLMSRIDPKDREMIKKETIQKKAKDMGIKFEDFNEEEFYLAFLLMFSMFHKTLGTSNMDVYLKMANTWMTSDDAKLQAGDKLMAYFETIVEGK